MFASDIATISVLVLASFFVQIGCAGGGTASESSSAAAANTDTGASPATDVPTTAAADATTAETTAGTPTAGAGGITSTDDTGVDPTDITSTSTSTGDAPCEQGTILCDAAVAQVCDGAGGFESEEACPMACVPGLGCVLCTPGEGVCNGPVAHQCDEQGSGFVDTVCDDVQGLACEDGACVGACAPNSLGASYIGCDYYAVITSNVVNNMFDFAVIVSNVSDEDADVTITRGDEAVVDILVPANTLEIVRLPWITLLKTAAPSKVVEDGAYRIRSTRPITAYQYSPLDYTKDGKLSYTNDASLLIPVNVWGRETFVVARNTHQQKPGAYSVVAREDQTTVTLTPSATGKSVSAGGGVAADGSGVVMLDRGDVLVVHSAMIGGEPRMPDVSDVTGTRVASDRPVMILGSHTCTYVPWNKGSCDHLEELNLPLDNLSREYLVSSPLVKLPNMTPQIKGRIVRIVATRPGTTISYEPPQNGAPTLLADAGDYAELQTEADFRISANHKIVVAEYMLGEGVGIQTGDPSMTIAVPTEQFRNSYLFHAPTNYESSFANIIAPIGATIALDGQPIAGLTPIGASGFGVARVQLSNAGDGDHTIDGDERFSVQVYGYGEATSYWYPGGLDFQLVGQ